MPTTKYYTSNGDLVPGVTTVLNVADKPALKPWAYKQGKADGARETNGKIHSLIKRVKKKDYPLVFAAREEFERLRSEKFGDETKALGLYAKSGAAAEAGTIAHDMIECSLHRQKWVPPKGVEIPDGVLEAANKGFMSYRRWAQNMKLKVLHTELHLVSDKYEFGGTPDAIGTLGERKALCLLDWKTSNGGPYLEQVAQLAAYIMLWEEANPEPEKKIMEAHLCRFDKRRATFHHSSWQAEDLEPAKRYFLSLRAAHHIQPIVKELC